MSVTRDAMGTELTAAAAEAARTAGAHVARRFRERMSTERKRGHYDLVTACDREAEEIVVTRLLRAFPGSTIVAEEGGTRGDGAIQWFVDPIDGTNNFASGLPFFCVSIGAAVGERLVAAAIYDPVRDELFTASAAGAFLGGAPIRARDTTAAAEALLLTDHPVPSDGDERSYALLRALVTEFRAVRRVGSTALALAYVACGRADVTFATDANPWDVAAGALLVEQAGARYVAIAPDGVPWRAPRFVACAPGIDPRRTALAALWR